MYCKNNPVAYVDLNGNFVISATVWLIIGTGLLSAGIDFGVQMWQNGGDLSSVDYRSVVASGVSGMVTTALGPYSIGATLGTTILGGALVSGIGYGTYHIVNGTETTLLGWINSMAWGGFFAGWGYRIHNKNNQQLCLIDTQGTELKIASPDSKTTKASWFERKFTTTASIDDLFGNPADEFFIEPSETAMRRHMEYIRYNGTIDAPIIVQKLASGGYRIVDGHHRWYAALKMGLSKVPIEIKNYRY